MRSSIVTGAAVNILHRRIAQHEIEEGTETRGGLVRANPQFLEWLIEAVLPQRGVPERLRADSIPSAKGRKQYVLLREMQAIHAQPIRARIWLVGVVGVSADKGIKESEQPRALRVRAKHRRAEVRDRDDANSRCL